MRFGFQATLATFFLMVLPRIGYACPVCFSAEGESRIAYLKSTIFLTFLPLVAGVVTYLWLRRLRRQRWERQAPRPFYTASRDQGCDWPLDHGPPPPTL